MNRFLLPAICLLIAIFVPSGSAAAKTPPPRPNLVISELSATPTKALAGGKLTILDQAKNTGKAKSKSVVVSYFLSADRKRDKTDLSLGARRSIGTLKAGKKSRVRSQRTLPAGIIGTRFVIACASGATRESNGKDNCRTAKSPLTIAAPPATNPGTGGTVPGEVPSVPGNPAVKATRNDAAAQTFIANSGTMLLERYVFGSSGQTADYWRFWLFSDNTYRYNVISWNSVGGETCTSSLTGTWSFLEGYTFDAQGGGYIYRLQFAGGITGPEIFAWGFSEPNNLYIGPNSVQYESNPQMVNNC